MPVILQENQNVCQMPSALLGLPSLFIISREGSFARVRRAEYSPLLSRTCHYWQKKRNMDRSHTQEPNNVSEKPISLSPLLRTLVLCGAYVTSHISPGKNEKGPAPDAIWKREDSHQWSEMVWHMLKGRKITPLFKGFLPRFRNHLQREIKSS